MMFFGDEGESFVDCFRGRIPDDLLPIGWAAQGDAEPRSERLSFDSDGFIPQETPADFEAWLESERRIKK
jgi:hypothetical protein